MGLKIKIKKKKKGRRKKKGKLHWTEKGQSRDRGL